MNQYVYEYAWVHRATGASGIDYVQGLTEQAALDALLKVTKGGEVEITRVSRIQ